MLFTLTPGLRMDVESVIASLEYYGGVAPSIVGQHVRLPGGSWGVASREPLGVVGGVGAWNYPMQVRWMPLHLTLPNKITLPLSCRPAPGRLPLPLPVEILLSTNPGLVYLSFPFFVE